MKPRSVIKLPRWVLWAYAAWAVLLIPWISYLAVSLPTGHLSSHWDLLWSGFDIILLLAILTSVVLTMRRSPWIIISASVLAGLLVSDAWFDILTAHTAESNFSIVLAFLIELPLATVSLGVAGKVLNQIVTSRSNLK